MSVLKWIAGSTPLLIILGIVIWGVGIEPRFLLDVQEQEAEVPNLPSAWEGQKVALLADLQVGMWWDNTGMIEKAVATTIEEQPALALIAGDFVYTPDSAIVREAVGYVRPLAEAGIPTYAVLGNHDYSLMKRDSEERPVFARYLADELEAAGIEVVENEAIPVTREGGSPLYLVGVGSVWAEEAHALEAINAVPSDGARIVLMHNPVAFRELPAESAPLALAAHTHGGQIRLPLFRSESWLDVAREREVIADGWATDSIGAPGNRAYVNRGLGFSTVPARIMCRPELTLFTLRSSGVSLPERGPETDSTATPATSDT